MEREPQTKAEQAAQVSEIPRPEETPRAAPTQGRQVRTRAVAQQIATVLNEREKGPYVLIERSVKILGEEIALDLLRQTEAVEAAGGMMLPDDSRRRTPGGVYFVLVRKLATADERRRIFQHNWQQKPHPAHSDGQPAQSAQPQKQQQITKPPTDASIWTWAERAGILEQTEVRRGEARVKVTIIGRPEQLTEQGKCVVFTMQQAPKIPALPAGIPLPPLEQVQATRYSVYIASKQWRKVEEAITDPEDALIVEGFQFLDQERRTIAVLASNVTTKLIQQANKRAKSERESKPAQT